MANAKSSTPSAFPHDPNNPTSSPIQPFILIASDGKVLRSVEEVTSHLLKPERLSDLALERLLEFLSTTKAARQDDEQPPSFREPWNIGDFGDVVTCEGNIVVDPSGSTLEHTGRQDEFMTRICACVNACEGIPTGDLKKATGLIVRVGGQ